MANSENNDDWYARQCRDMQRQDDYIKLLEWHVKHNKNRKLRKAIQYVLGPHLQRRQWIQDEIKRDQAKEDYDPD